MKTLHIKTTAALCKRLFKLERSGQYQKALTELEDIWHDKTGLPEVEDLEPKLAAEVLLRCGSLIGFLGHNKQIPESQETSKNLLSEARNRFLKLYDFEKVAECENYIALAYQRTGEVNEAEVWIEQAISSDLPASNNTKIQSYVVKSLILLSSRRYFEIIKTLSVIENDVLRCNDNSLKGSFYNQLGIAWEMSNNISKSLATHELAKKYYTDAKHKIYLGTIHNDIALLYKTAKNFDKAYEMADIAIQIFKQNKDRTRQGFAFDTKAQIFLAENKFSEALEAAEIAVRILRLSENTAYLVECFQTKIKTLLFLDRFTDAAFCLVEAVQIAKTQISEEAAKNLIAEFEKVLQIKEARKINQAVTETAALYENQNSPAENPDLKETGKSNRSPKNDEDLQLSLPKELAQYDSEDLRGVWISSTDLEEFGLTPASLALIAKGEVKRGELAAIEEKASGKVTCGLYDTAFGLISLEGADGELQLFDADKFKILGKIVGVGKKKSADGKLIIEMIDSI